MILLFGSNLAWYSEQIHCDEKILKMMVRVYAACGTESSKWANVAIKIFKFLCWEALQSPLFALDVLHVLHLSPIWRQNLGQIQNFENILIENSVYVEVNIDTRIKRWPCRVVYCQNCVIETWAD